MSKGPGKWQRRILEALEDVPWTFLVDIMSLDYSRSDYVAARRSAISLWESGRQVWIYYKQPISFNQKGFTWNRGQYKVLICRPGVEPPDWKILRDIANELNDIKCRHVADSLGMEPNELRWQFVQNNRLAISMWSSYEYDPSVIMEFTERLLSVAPVQ